jgi:murein DD-endopeptidase MepM/ murein hydrolase activator NlpD
MMKIRFLFVTVLFFICGCTYIGPGSYHTVSKGETIWDISSAYGTNVNEIIRANRLLKNPNRIKAGQKIYVPGARHSKKVPKSSLDFIWPVKGKIIKKFGKYGNKRYLGIEIKAKEGQPVYAAESGTVIFANNNFRSYGKTIIIEHNKNYATVYAHNSMNLVKKNKSVEKGQKIAEVGRTGRAKTPNLYFEIRYKEKPRNPIFMLP